MKKTLNINLAGLVFTMDEDAYTILKNYLDSISAHFEKNEGKEEILSDIENRIAENFSAHKNPSKQVIVIEDVQKVIERMGRVEDFFSEEQSKQNTTQEKYESGNNSAPRRLYRDVQHGIIGGVASGISHYFGIDVTVVRVLFVVLTFFAGITIPVYLLLWIITPKAETFSQKAEMLGKNMTLKDIEEHVKEIIEEGKTRIQSLRKK